MIPILYENSETAYRSNGIGRLRDCVKCIVTEARNGIYECEFDYPITGVHYSDIREGMIVACTHDQTGDIQPFEIYRRKEPIDGVVTFYAHHISYRLLNVILRPFTAEGVAAALAGFKTNSANDNPFTFWTDKTTQGTYTIKQPSSLREMLAGTSGSLLDVFGTGDYEFDRFTVRLWADRGADNGVTIRYGKNLADIERDKDLSGTYNAVAPYWTDQDLENVVTLPEIIVTSPTLINIASEPWTDDARQQMTDENGEPFLFDYAPIKAVPLDVTADFDNEPTPDQMRQKALAKMASGRNWLPSTNIDVDFVALEDTPEYADVAPLQRVSLCDTVRVIYPGVGLDVKEKVIKTDYNVLLNAYDRVELGNPTSSLSDVITAQTEGKIAKDYPTKGFLENALDNATQLITGGLGGHVVFNMNANGEPQEILIMDTDDKTTAVNVIRINKKGIGFSNTGYEGPFSSAWTIDNTLDMSQINVANMNANAITAGTLQSQDGGNSWNLETGIFQTRGTNDRIIKINGGALDMYAIDGDTERHIGALFPMGLVEENDGFMLGMTEDSEYIAFGWETAPGVWKISMRIASPNYDEYSDRIRMYASMRAYSQATFERAVYCGREVFICQDAASADNDENTNRSMYLYYNSSGYAGLVVKDNGYTQDVIQYSGNGNQIFYRFAPNVYITYHSNTDTIYASKTITQASDEKLKLIRAYKDEYDELLDKLEPIVYKWKDRPDGPERVGLGARKTREALLDLGLDDSGFVCVYTDENGNDQYSVDYQELSVMLLHAYQKQKKELEDLKAKVQTIMDRLEV